MLLKEKRMWLGRKRLWLERGRKGRGEGENKGEAMKKVLGLERKWCDFGEQVWYG